MADLVPTKSYRRIPVGLELPHLIQVQIDSFERLKRDGFTNLFAEISPIESYNQGMQLYFCLLYTSPSPRDRTRSRMPSSA